jgi:iron complex outermembrane receptor protein
LRGVFGVQAEALDFQALGAEAFVPATRTRSTAVFVLEELPLGSVDLSAGARIEDVSVASAGDGAGASQARFGAAATRRFSPSSLSLGAHWHASPAWHLGASLGSTERAPAYYELYAKGVHVATAAFELGDPLLQTERSRHAELDLAWTQGAHSAKVSVFDTRFSRFISLDATGSSAAESGAAALPVYAFRTARARMSGIEIEGRTRLLDQAWTLDLTGGLDTVRGDNLDRNEPLPRLAPRRIRLGLEAAWQGLRAGLGWRQLARQDRVPATDTATPGYSMLDLWASGRLPLGDDSTWFARLNNVTDTLASNAATIATMRGLAPLPGRALSVGLRSRF